MILKKWIFAIILLASVFTRLALPQDRAPVETQVSQLVIPVTVVAQNNLLVTALSQESFSILVDKTPQPILSFNKQDQGASVVILFDLSGSMYYRFGDQFFILKEALSSFAQSSNPANEYSLFTFDRQVNQMLNWSQSAEGLMRKINEIEILKPVGKTVFFDACVKGLQVLSARENKRHAMLIISDGGDNDSTHRFEEVKKLAYETQTAIYFLNVSDLKLSTSAQGGAMLDFKGQGMSEELAKASGGVALIPRLKGELFDSTQRLAKYIRYRYWIGISSTAIKKDAKPHKLQVKVSLPPDAPKEVKDLKILYPQFHLSRGQ